MDEEELLENKNSLEQDVLLLEFYGKNLAALERLEQTPYFGKVGFTYEENGEHLPVYIGVNGFRPKERKLPLVYDWRAPISSLYYAYEKGPAKYQAPEGTFQGVIDEKKQFQIREGKMQYMLDTDLRIDDDVLQRELGENHGSKMKQIAATIQKEQNEIIRNAAEETLVIDGCAGSGKTVIALHRIAWLLYNHRERLNTQNVMILSPNAFFRIISRRYCRSLVRTTVSKRNLMTFWQICFSWKSLMSLRWIRSTRCSTRRTWRRSAYSGSVISRRSHILSVWMPI